MAVETQKYIKKPLYVDAVRITEDNFWDIVSWCQGEVQEHDAPGDNKKHIRVRVHNPKNQRQTKAFIGDWLLYTERGYKVYTNKAFHASFDLMEGVEPQSYITQADGVQEVIDETESEYEAPAVTVLDSAPPVVEDIPITDGDVPEMTKVPEAFSVVPPVETPEWATEQLQNERMPAEPAGVINEVPVMPQESPPVPADTVESMPEQETVDPAAVEGKRVLSIREQRRMTQDEIRELVQSGEAVLAQDIAQA